MYLKQMHKMLNKFPVKSGKKLPQNLVDLKKRLNINKQQYVAAELLSIVLSCSSPPSTLQGPAVTVEN